MSSSESRDQRLAWLAQRAGTWQSTVDKLPILEDDKPIPAEALREALNLYPEVARDLAVARRVAAGSRLTAHLEYLYAGLHRAIHKRPRTDTRQVLSMFRSDVPQAAFELRRHILWVTVGFVLATLAGWSLVSTYPQLASLFASPGMIKTVEAGNLWTDGLLNVTPPSVLSVGLFANNIAVALTAMALGALYGLGTLYIIGLNGLMLGCIFAFTAQYQLAGRLFEFVCAHGFVELSVICVAGAVGFSIGESLARPGHLTRRAAFQSSVRRGMQLMSLCVLFLIGAGLIEGYVSPDPRFGLGARLAIGLSYWFVFVWALCGWPLGRSSETVR